MLPLIFITNRINYSRWLPVYLLDMFNLPPEVVSKYESGNFAIRQKPSDFNGIWSDMAREKAVIKDSKGYGGIVNITRHKSTLIRWSLTRHVLADVSAEMRQRYRISALADKMMHEESTPTCLKRDEVHINPELVFRRDLVLANSRDNVTIENVLSFSVSPIPTSLIHDYGTMRKS
jgi:hypothetical protein